MCLESGKSSRRIWSSYTGSLAVDAENDTYGKLYVNGAYLRCKVLKSAKEGWKGYVYSEVEITFQAPELVWVVEATRQFLPQLEETAASGIDFQYDYPFDFAGEKEESQHGMLITSFQASTRMIIYGPCVNPKILINDYPYEFFVTLESREYLIIDSQRRTIRRYLTNGTVQNLFNQRAQKQTVFERIPSGLLNINWSGDYGFDLTLFLNRREPPW